MSGLGVTWSELGPARPLARKRCFDDRRGLVELAHECIDFDDAREHVGQRTFDPSTRSTPCRSSID
jgi:hypothetical protein